MDRRGVLALGGAVGGSLALAGLTAIARAHPGDHGPVRPQPAPVVKPFTVSMPVPPVLSPLPGFFGADHYRIPVRKTQIEVFPGRWTSMLTYDGRFVGPTIRAKAGRPAIVSFDNELTEATNTHLHGGYVAAEHDGYPMDLISPGSRRSYEYPNAQPGATLWYHDHAHHSEAEHLYRGLHGFYLIDDASEDDLGLPGGPCDVPILMRDALFDADAGLVFNPKEPARRPTILANGRPQPYFAVAPCLYRLRLLNASTARILRLHLGGQPMTQIATDGGLLAAPVALTELSLSPAERAEVIVDFSKYPLGSQLVLSDASGPVLRFDVVKRATCAASIPEMLRPLPSLGSPSTHRDFTFGFNPSAIAFEINGKPFDPDRAEVAVKRGGTETWRITNLDRRGALNIDHNFHPHAAQFRILDRDGVPPAESEAGIKDTAWIPPGTSLRVQIKFGEFPGRYVFHCHMLEHAAMGMMAQLSIV